MSRGSGHVAPALAVFVLRRLVAGVALLAIVAATTFVLITLAPGDTAEVLAGQAGADPEYLELIRERLGLDRSLTHQIGAYLWELAHGDLGYSVVQGQPVLDAIVGRLWPSFVLAGTALTLAIALGVALGAVAAWRHGGAVDGAISVGSLLGYSLPVFWLGQLLIGLFAVRLGWLPAGGMSSADGEGGIGDALRHLVLPAATLSLLLVALIVRITRSAMDDALAEDYVTVARAKGLSERQVVVRHALRNALRPVITIVTGYFGLLLTGAVLVETVFVWPGLGRLLYQSALARDTPMLAGILLLSALVVVLANLVADVLYRALDPRVGFE